MRFRDQLLLPQGLRRRSEREQQTRSKNSTGGLDTRKGTITLGKAERREAVQRDAFAQRLVSPDKGSVSMVPADN